jgi:hypothetical protein
MGMWDSGIGGELTGGRSAKNAIKRGIAAQKKATMMAKNNIKESTLKAEGIAQAGYGAAGDYLNKGFEQGIGSVNQGFSQGFDYMNQAQGRLDPIAGMFDPSMGNQFSIGGIADNLSQFSDPNGPFGQLIADRMASSGEAAAGAGLARSGNRMAEAGRIPMQEALGLNSMLFSQQLQNPALAAIQAQSGLDQSMGGMAISQGNTLAGLQTGQGGALAALEQSKLQDLSNMALGEGSNLANLNVGMGAAQAAGQNAIASSGMAAANMGMGLVTDGAKALAGIV